MFCIFAYDYNNRKMAVPAAFETEDDAWDAIQQIMSQENHPKMAWIEKGVIEYADVSGNSDSSN